METNAIKVAVQDSHIRPIIKAVSWRILAHERFSENGRGIGQSFSVRITSKKLL